MFLHIDVSDEWTTTAVDDGRVHRLGDTSIHALQIRELPVDVERWMQRVALRGAPEGTAWKERGRANLSTVDGWPARLREIELDHASFQRVRIVAYYQFTDYASGAIVDVHASWYEPQRTDLIDLLGTARPDWGPQALTCLARQFGDARHKLLTLK